MVMTLDATAARAAPPLEFDLPPELEAREPPEARGLARDEVRLLVSRRTDDSITHAAFLDLPRFLDPGDLLVVNDSATLPAAIAAVLEDGSEIALHLSTQLESGLWVLEPRQVAVRRGANAALPGGASVRFVAPHRGSARLWLARLETPEPAHKYLARWGRPISYSYLRGEWPIEMYQTVFAAKPGSAEMPSAGRAFSLRVLAALAGRGVRVAAITLHSGVASLEKDEPPYEEWFEVTPETARAVNETRAAGARVIAVGTTVVRALESAADDTGRVQAARGWTELVITPERGVASIDALLTGFHEPRASHLSMLAAIAGHGHLDLAYRAALRGRYLWHEFGDLHLIV
jgi:S-adenosylmethionine:tRNA ribosyltransferase-isomerase